MLSQAEAELAMLDLSGGGASRVGLGPVWGPHGDHCRDKPTMTAPVPQLCPVACGFRLHTSQGWGSTKFSLHLPRP